MEIKLNTDQQLTLIDLIKSKKENLEKDIKFYEEDGDYIDICNYLKKELETITQLEKIFTEYLIKS